MTIHGRSDHRGGSRLPLCLTVLLIGAVCAGIVAMHQLAGGGHHATMAMPATATHSSSNDMVSAIGAVDALPPTPSRSVAHEQASNSTVSGAMSAACMSVLLAGMLVLSMTSTAGWRERRRGDTTATAVRTGGPRPGRGPPRDLLAQLCVLRT